MSKIIFDTNNTIGRLIDQKSDFVRFSNYVKSKGFTRFGESFAQIQSWWDSLPKDSINVFLLDKLHGYPVGIIVGRIYDEKKKELEIEYFFSSQTEISSPILTKYMQYCICEKKLRNFRFLIPSCDIDQMIILSSLGARHNIENDLTSNGRLMLVYKIQNTL